MSKNIAIAKQAVCQKCSKKVSIKRILLLSQPFEKFYALCPKCLPKESRKNAKHFEIKREPIFIGVQG